MLITTGTAIAACKPELHDRLRHDEFSPFDPLATRDGEVSVTSSDSVGISAGCETLVAVTSVEGV